MMPLSYRDTWAEVSLDAIYDNMRLFKSKLSASCLLMAVVKADGYGHGAVEVAHVAMKAGADYLGVAFLDEALQLRSAGIELPILLLGYTPCNAIETAISRNITIAVSSSDIFDKIVFSAIKLGRQARVHLKVDTGMSRLGFRPDEVLHLCRHKTNPSVMIEGLFTHFADADNPDNSFTLKQYSEFVALIDQLSENGIDIPLKHCCNSAAAMRHPDMRMDMVRIGIAMYGLSPLHETSLAFGYESYPLREAMQFKTRISFLKWVTAHHPIGYGLTCRTSRESLIATLPVGYADGLSRSLSNRGFVLVRGKRIPIVGTVCMDQTMIDVTLLPDLQVGDEVVLFGISAGVQLAIHEIASLLNTIPYEVVCSISKRVPRVFTGV